MRFIAEGRLRWLLRRRWLVLVTAVVSMAALTVLAGCTPQVELLGSQRAAPQEPFPDFGQAPPPTYDGPFFRMRQDYPVRTPSFTARDYPWLEIDFNQDWTRYIEAVKNYAFEGNVEADWYVENNRVRNWYHAPWQHWGGQGREFVQGLTSEISNKPGTLGPAQTQPYGTYAVGMYNEPGGYIIGQVWKDHQLPNPAVAKFPVGTAVVKILFTDAPVAQAPQLDNVPTWQAWVPNTPSNNPTKDQPRSLKEVRLVQIDLAVRDDRAFENGGTGWVFGTYAANGRLGNSNPWMNVEPVGMMWGNDPTVTSGRVSPIPATATNFNPDIQQSRISQSPTIWPQHLGWGGRLNGPVDSPSSSCLSCHSTAQAPAISQMVAPSSVQQGSPEWMNWFRNVRATEAFDPGRATSLDYSLQLAVGIQNFYTAKNAQVGGFYTNQYVGDAEFRLRRGVD